MPPKDRKEREREESKRDDVSVRKVSIFMVCFIKVTIIQWYIVLNSQKYEQIPLLSFPVCPMFGKGDN